MNEAYRALAILGIVWGLGCLCAFLSVLGSLLSPARLRWLWCTLSVVAAAIGYAGLFRPFPWLPNIGWTGDIAGETRYVNFNWFFVAPLCLGILALPLAVIQPWLRRPTGNG